MSIRSTNNFSLTPLDANRIYIGSYDTVTQYATAVITLNSDTDCELTIYSSVDKIRTIKDVYASTGGTPLVKFVPLITPYVYMTVRNTEATAQTYMNFEVIYRETSVPEPAGTASNVSIFDSAGDDILRHAGTDALQVYVENPSITIVPSGTQEVQIVADDVGLALESTLSGFRDDAKFKGTATLWNASPVSANGVSSAQQSDDKTTMISVFGVTTGSTTITLQTSLDGTTYYDTQYSISANGDFGFSIPFTFKYVRFKSSSAVTITLRIVYC